MNMIVKTILRLGKFISSFPANKGLKLKLLKQALDSWYLKENYVTSLCDLTYFITGPTTLPNLVTLFSTGIKVVVSDILST